MSDQNLEKEILKDNIKRKLGIESFTLKGRASIDTMDLIQSYKILESKKQFINLGINPSDINIESLTGEDKQELGNISVLLKKLEAEIKGLKDKDKDNPRIAELEKKVSELNLKTVGMVSSTNQGLLMKALSFDVDTRNNQKQFEKNVREVRNEIYDYLPKALNFEANKLEELAPKELLNIIEILIAENQIETTVFF